MKTWDLRIEGQLTGDLRAILSEPGKIDTSTPITKDQLPWFNALRYLRARDLEAQ